MQLHRRDLMRLAASATLVAQGTQSAKAQTFPSKTIKLLVPYVPGSPVDVLARVVARQMAERLGQAITIENRPGAGALIATKTVAAAPPDGHTLLISGQTLTYLNDFYPDLGFDPVKAIAPVATLAGWSHVLIVNPGLPVTSVTELVALAKAKPGTLNFGFGVGTSPQILGEYFKIIAELDIVSVPYKGGEEVRMDLIGGRIQMNFAPYGNVRSMIDEGQLRPLAVTSARRMSAMPDVPTMAEAGFPQIGFDPDIWHGIVAPLGTPEFIIRRLNAVANECLRSPEVKDTFEKLTFDPIIDTPEGFGNFLAIQAEKWPKVIKAANLRPQ